MTRPGGIGTLREKHLHAALKEWYAERGDRAEVEIDGYVVDLVRADLLIEIQTRGFSSMKRKIRALIDEHPIRLVHPIAGEKWLVKLHPGRDEPERRRSPRRGTVHDVFTELVSFPDLIEHPHFELDVLVTTEEEVRRFDGTRGRRRRGWVIEERRLLDVQQAIRITDAADLLILLPADLGRPFTTAELAVSLGRPRRLAQQMAYCLRSVGVIEVVGKSGNSLVYEAREPTLEA